jgi:hypothetical protein
MKIQATHLVVRDLPYEVRVLLHPESSILINLDAKIRQNVLVERIGSTASIRGTAQRQHRDAKEFFPDSRSSLLIPSSPNQPRIDVYVPLKTPLAFSGVKRAVIDAIDGPMQIVAPPGTERISIGSMHGGSIVVGGGLVEVGRVMGDALSLTSLGKGTITVKGGTIKQLTGIVVGGGAIFFHGGVEVATLAMRGHGSLDVAQVSIPFSTCSGRGTIRIAGQAI